jgi:fucose 4-O-acetylase-like acetyltransferase
MAIFLLLRCKGSLYNLNKIPLSKIHDLQTLHCLHFTLGFYYIFIPIYLFLYFCVFLFYLLLVNTLFDFIACLSPLLMSFGKEKILILMKPNSSFFFFFNGLCFWYLRSLLLIPGHKSSLPSPLFHSPPPSLPTCEDIHCNLHLIDRKLRPREVK